MFIIFLVVFSPLNRKFELLNRSSRNSDINEKKILDSELFLSSSNLLDSNFVVSVEIIDIIISAGENYSSTSLSKNQNVSNCVPFVTMSIDYFPSSDWDNLLADVYFESDSNKISVERSPMGTTSRMNFYIYVVEFDETKINVQQGNFNITDFSRQQKIDIVNQSKAVVLSYWYAQSGGIFFDHAMVTTYFSGDNELSFRRNSSMGEIFGHYYVFEAKKNEFDVQFVSFKVSGTAYNATINPVDMSKSMVISSFCTPVMWDARDAMCDIWLANSTILSAERYWPNSDVYVNAFVVNFSGYITVQRGDFTYPHDTSGRIASINAVDLTIAMVRAPNPYSMMRASGEAYFAASCAQYRFLYNNSIEGRRGMANSEVTGHWEVVEWGLIPDFELSSNSDIPVDTDGNYLLNWTASFKAQNYTLYRYDKFITEINISLIIISENLTSFSYTEVNLPHNANYYYIVVAWSPYGTKNSNCIQIKVSKKPLPFILITDAEEPDTDGSFFINWTDSLYVDNYSIYLSHTYILDIDDSVSLVASNITALSFSISNFTNGLYYFVVIALTEYANMSSNVINIVIFTTPTASNPRSSFPLLETILIALLASAGLTFLGFIINKRYLKITKFQKEVRKLKNRISKGKNVKNSELTREDKINQILNQVTPSIKLMNKKLVDKSKGT
ncbi:MAG: hypothetical protein ACXABO_09005 [Promethearchaeota archaeon]